MIPKNDKEINTEEYLISLKKTIKLENKDNRTYKIIDYYQFDVGMYITFDRINVRYSNKKGTNEELKQIMYYDFGNWTFDKESYKKTIKDFPSLKEIGEEYRKKGIFRYDLKSAYNEDFINFYPEKKIIEYGIHIASNYCGEYERYLEFKLTTLQTKQIKNTLDNILL
ncbi:MAG: hypothetical protein ACP5N1_02805 [Candidatus Woesearchaeota archaeon]